MIMSEVKNCSGYFVKLRGLSAFVALFFFCHQDSKAQRKHKEEIVKVLTSVPVISALCPIFFGVKTRNDGFEGWFGRGGSIVTFLLSIYNGAPVTGSLYFIAL